MIRFSKMHFSCSRQRGLTIVEILVAMVVSLILLGGVLQIFISNQRTAALQESMSRVQENARFASHFLTRNIREAGYQGCGLDVPVVNTLNNNDTASWDLGVGLEGYDNVGTNLPARLSATGIQPIPGTDVVIVRAPRGEPAGISRNNNSAQLFALQVTNNNRICADNSDSQSGLCRGDVVMVSDCQKARVFQITNLQATGGEVNVVHSGSNDFTPGNEISSWGGQGNNVKEDEIFGDDAEIIRVETTIYFIGAGEGGEPALFAKTGNADPQELVAGVENMQITYGINSAAGSGVNAYVNAADVSNQTPGSGLWRTAWGEVMVVRIALLLRSPDAGQLDQPQTVSYADGEVDEDVVADRRYRQVTEATITLRNRVN